MHSCTIFHVHYTSIRINRSVVGLVVYFVVGILVLKMRYGKTGTDVIPNKTFWKELPFLIKVIHGCIIIPGYFLKWCSFFVLKFFRMDLFSRFNHWQVLSREDQKIAHYWEDLRNSAYNVPFVALFSVSRMNEKGKNVVIGIENTIMKGPSILIFRVVNSLHNYTLW